MEFTFDKQWMKMHGLVGIILTLGFYSKTWLNDAFMCLQEWCWFCMMDLFGNNPALFNMN